MISLSFLLEGILIYLFFQRMRMVGEGRLRLLKMINLLFSLEEILTYRSVQCLLALRVGREA
jgi:hypothetical protein